MDICTSCGNLIQYRDIHLSDGRGICTKCFPAVVKTRQHILWVNERVFPILEKYGVNNIPKDIPVTIVSTMELAKVQNRTEINLMQLGLTYTKFSANILGTKMNHRIYIVEGLHKILFAGTLAHEYLHVWQFEHHIKLPSLYCEGFCNMGTYLVYRNIATELSHTLYVRMRDGNDPIYCEGFRQVKTIFDNEGEKDLLKTMNILISKNNT